MACSGGCHAPGRDAIQDAIPPQDTILPHSYDADLVR